MHRRNARLLALALGCAGALGLYVLLAPRPGPPDRARPNVQYRRVRTIPELPEPGSGPWRYWMPEEAVRQLYSIVPPGTVYDPWCHFRYPDSFDGRQTLPEFPGGFVRMRANANGLRKDEEVRAERPDLRILVTGDSHTDGVVPNSLSFANRLERMLARAAPERSVEVLNAGKGGYSFFQYMGALECHRALDPHLYVVTVYGGNDFEELLLPHYAFARKPRPRGKVDTWPAMERALAMHPAPSQGLVAVNYFHHNPEQVDVALEVALRISGEIAELCAARGTRLLFVYLPPPYAPLAPAVREVLDRQLEVLGLDHSDLEVFDRMADRFLAGLAERGIAHHDLRPAFAASDQLLYWLTDHHINRDGHALVARELAPVVERIFGPQPVR